MAYRKERTKTGKFAEGNTGRPKGSKNKLTTNAKEAFSYAFDKIGGAEKLAQWAVENTTEFYKLYARLIPVEQRIGDPEGKAINFTLYVPPKA